MRKYSYKCVRCEKKINLWDDEPLRCPNCGSIKVRREFSRPAVPNTFGGLNL